MHLVFKKTMSVSMVVFVIGCTQTETQNISETKSVLVPKEVVLQHVDGQTDTPRVQDKNEARDEAELMVIDGSRRDLSKDKRNDVLLTPQAAPVRMLELSVDQGIVSINRNSAFAMDAIRIPSEPVNRENYKHFDDNPIKRVLEDPVSTFSIDVDTGSYANVRRMINSGILPQKDAVRAEELINYFSYNYPSPDDSSVPFEVFRELAPTPWNKDTHLLHIGVKGYERDRSQLPASNLVFLLDVSGSMNSADKLGLLKSSLKLLTRQLRPEDSVSIVVYAGASGVVLEPTSGNEKAKIIASLDRLSAGGSTNGAAGIRLAYAMAEQAFKKDGINRVLLATDGDFNVGTVNIEQLKDLVAEKRKTGIALTTLGFGTGNFNDHLMEQIADIGNGNYAYIDTLNEAQKVLVDEMGSTMLTIAKDVKIQIEFNPAVVSEYRLIGYENRHLNREDFNNDKVDAGDIGAGHTVTAIYEIALVESKGQRLDTLRYQSESPAVQASNEIAFLKMRYKAPDSDESELLEWAISSDEILADISNTSDAFRHSAAVAAFAQNLRGGEFTGSFDFEAIKQLAQSARGEDPFGYRGEFLNMVNLAASLRSTDVRSGTSQLSSR